MSDRIYPATALDDTVPVTPSAPVIPVRSTPEPKQNAASMALDWDGWLESQEKPVQQRIQASLSQSPDRQLYQRRLINTLWISEREGISPRDIGKNYELHLRSHAEKNGWGDIWRDDSKFQARVSQQAKFEQAEQFAFDGQPGDSEEARASREKSLLVRAYWSAAEGDEVRDDMDMVKGFASWQKDSITAGSFNPANAVKNYRAWVQMYNKGREDLGIAIEVAQKVLPVLRTAGDTGGGNIGTVLQSFRGLTPEQRNLALNQISLLQGKSGDQSPLAATSTTKQTVAAAGRSLRNIGLSAEESAMKEQLARGGWKEGERISPEVYNSIVDLAGGSAVPENVGSFQDWPQLTKKQAEYLNSNKEEAVTSMELAFRLRNFAQQEAAPFRKDTIPQMGAITLGESLPYMALAAVPGGIGLPVLQQSYAYDAENKLIQSGIPREKAQMLSEFIGAGQAALDVVSLGLLKKAPGMKEVFDFATRWTGLKLLAKGAGAAARKTGASAAARAASEGFTKAGAFLARNTANLPAQALLRFGGTTVAETVQELTQDILVEAAVMEVGNWFDKTLPDVDWRAVRDGMLAAAPETMFSMMLMSSIGAGLAARRDVKNIELLTQDTRAMELLGFTPERISQIQSGGDAFSLFKRAFAERVQTTGTTSPVEKPKINSVKLLKAAWPERSITEKGDSATRGIGASYEWARKRLDEKAEIASKAAPVTEEEDGLFTVDKPDGTQEVAETKEEAVNASIAAFEEQVLNPALEQEEQQDAKAGERPDISELDAEPVTTDTEAASVNDPDLNAAAGVSRIFRDDNGWQVEPEEAQPGAPKTIITGQGPDGLAEALQIREQMAAARLAEQRREQMEQEEKEQGEPKISFAPAVGETLSAEGEAARQALEEVAGDILPAFQKVFTGVDVVESYEGGPTGGFFVNKDTGRLGVSLVDIARELGGGRLKDKRKWAASALIEEAIHYVAAQLERDGKLSVGELIQSVKEDSPAFYRQLQTAYTRQNQKTGKREAVNDAVLADEFIRMVTQGRVKFDLGKGVTIDGEFTEMQFSDRIIKNLKKALEQILRIVRDLEKKLPPELAADLKAASDNITSMLESLITTARETKPTNQNEKEKDAPVQDGQGRQKTLLTGETKSPRGEPVPTSGESSVTSGDRYASEPGLQAPDTDVGQADEVQEATPAEGVKSENEDTPPPDPRTWAAKNAATDAQRVRMGMQPRMEPMARKWGTVWSQAMAMIERASETGRDLASEILDAFRTSERILEDWEVAVLTHELVERETRYEAKKQSLSAAAGMNAKNEIRAELDEMNLANDELFNAIQETGTRTARALAIRKMMIDDHFDIVRMRSDMMAAQGGRPLTKEQSAAAQKTADDIAASQKKQEAKEDEILNSQIKAGLDDIRREIKDSPDALSQFLDSGEDPKPVEPSAIKEEKPEPVSVSPQRIAKAKGKTKARKDIEAKDGEGLPSRKLVYDLTAVRVMEGASDPEAIMSSVHEELRESWPELTLRQTKEIFTEYGKAKFPDKDELKRTLRELNVLVTQIVHLERMQAGEPILKKGFQRDKPTQQIREMYRRVSALKKKLGLTRKTDAQIASALDAAKTRLRNEIEDLTAYISQGGRTDAQKAPKEGLKYDEEAVNLVKIRDDLKARLEKLEGPKTPSFEEIVADTLKALEKTEESLTRRVESADFAPRAKVGAPVMTPEIEERLSYIQTLRQSIQEGRKALTGNTSAIREEKAKAAAYLRARDEYARRVRENDISPKTSGKKQTAHAQETAAAWQAMEAARKEYQDLRLSRQAEIDLAKDKENARRRITTLEKKLADKDYTVKKKRVREQDNELLELRLEEWKLKQQWLEGVFEAKRAEWNRLQRWGNSTANFFGWARAWMTGLDLSALGRQAGFMLLSRPVRTLKAVPVMMRAATSEAFALQHEKDLQDPAKRANAALYRRDKLQLTSPFAQNLEKVEEAYRTSWLNDPPGWLKVLMGIPGPGHLLRGGQGLVKASARAYTTVLNEIRADAYDALAKTLPNTGMPTEAQGKAIADMVNIWTGRGKIPGFKKSEEVLTAMNALFFAPRYVASRFQTVFMPFWLALREINTRGGNFLQLDNDKELAPVRKLLAAEYVRFFAGIGALWGLYTLFQGTGDDDDRIEFDPRSSAFGKLKFGRTFVDPLAGLAQIVTLTSRLTTQQGKTPAGQITEKNPLEVFRYFAETKLSPIAGSVRNLMAGKDLRGEPTSILGEATRLVVPMALRDIIETGQTQEWGAGTIPIVVAALAGWSVQNYNDTEKEKVGDDDYNWLYSKAIAIPKITLQQKLASIGGFREDDKESPWAKPITAAQRKKLLEITLPEVNAAVKELRATFKDAPKDPDAYLEFVKEQQDIFADQVKNAREAAVAEIVEE